MKFRNVLLDVIVNIWIVLKWILNCDIEDGIIIIIFNEEVEGIWYIYFC